MRSRSLQLGVVVLLATPTLAGCASPNTYATARTLSPGDVSHTLALEGIGYHGSQGTGAMPVLPTYGLRVGVVDRVDVGARVGNLTEIGADIKVNLLRGPLDVAIAGGGEAFIEWRYQPDAVRRTGSRAYFHAPLILSYNFSKTISLVWTPGIAYVVGRQVSDDFVRTQPFDGGTLAARLGMGVDYRFAPRRAFHPEVTVLQSTTASQAIVMFGLGFNFGGVPSYDDIEPPSAPAEPAWGEPPRSATPPPAASPPPPPAASPPPPPAATPTAPPAATPTAPPAATPTAPPAEPPSTPAGETPSNRPIE